MTDFIRVIQRAYNAGIEAEMVKTAGAVEFGTRQYFAALPEEHGLVSRYLRYECGDGSVVIQAADEMAGRSVMRLKARERDNFLSKALIALFRDFIARYEGKATQIAQQVRSIVELADRLLQYDPEADSASSAQRQGDRIIVRYDVGDMELTFVVNKFEGEPWERTGW